MIADIFQHSLASGTSEAFTIIISFSLYHNSEIGSPVILTSPVNKYKTNNKPASCRGKIQTQAMRQMAKQTGCYVSVNLPFYLIHITSFDMGFDLYNVRGVCREMKPVVLDRSILNAGTACRQS